MKILFYSNLPYGGAKQLSQALLRYIQNRAKIVELREDFHPKNLFELLEYAIFKAPHVHRDMLATNSYDVLLANHSWITKSPHLLRYSKKPTIYLCHDVLSEYYDAKFKKRRTIKSKIVDLLRLPIRTIDKQNVLNSSKLSIVANSLYEANFIKKVYKINPTVIYPGIDLKKFTPKTRTTTKKIAKKILTVGSLNRQKNQLYLLKAINTLSNKEKKHLKITMVGNGGEKQYVELLNTYARKNGIDLCIKQNVSNKQLLKEYQNADIFSFTPISEPFGLVVLEAMATGLPLITITGNGGYQEILPTNCVIYSKGNSPKHYGKDIFKLIYDQKMRRIMKNYGLELVKNFSIEKYCEEIWKIVKELS